MKKEDLEKLTSSIEQKLGKENFATISDDIAKISVYNDNTNKEIEGYHTEISQLKEKNEKLVESNGVLFQQVAMGKEEKEPEKEEKPKFKFKNAFDEKGNFI